MPRASLSNDPENDFWIGKGKDFKTEIEVIFRDRAAFGLLEIRRNREENYSMLH
jgi:hypothetical protein